MASAAVYYQTAQWKENKMSKQCSTVVNDDDVLLFGYYKKLKTMKKKFFVLYAETPSKVARIEYYDNEKKYKSGFTPKRVIKIKNCFNINRRLYTKHDFVIVLASKEGGFGIVMDSENEMNTWLNHLLHLQRSGETCFDFPKFDYVWQVIIQKKGIAEQRNIFGSHHICLTNKSVTFIKIGREKKVGEKKNTIVDVLLTTIRRCGDSHCYFYMEIGRQSSLGPGELWMEAEDSLTAQNMHKMILSKMVSLNETLVEPMRKRSSSATEATKLHHEIKSSPNIDIINNYSLNAQSFRRDRCDSLPSRNRTSSESTIKMIPASSANRIINLHGSNASPTTFSASEESISVADSEESIGISYLISSRSTEAVIPEEYKYDASHFTNIKKNSDINSMVGFSKDAIIKANILSVKQCGADNNSDINKKNDQLHFSNQICCFGIKCENDITTEATGNRVRAFSVGSRIRSTRLCSRASPKLFNGDSVDCSTRKSISVPMLINKSFKSTGHMGDLMEIDFSKSISDTLNSNFQHSRKYCQIAPNTLSMHLNISNSEELIQRNMQTNDNGYLEMKPITLVTNSVTYNGSNMIDDASAHSQKEYYFEQNEHKTDFVAPTEAIYDITSPKDTNIIRDFIVAVKDTSVKSNTSNSFTNSVFSSTCSENCSDASKSGDVDNSCVNKDLYYASLDLPKCDKEVNNRYGFQESLNETTIKQIENEYAKINFVQAETSRTKKKY